MMTREQILQTLITRRDNYKRFVKKLNPGQRKKINTFKIRIMSLETCIRDLEQNVPHEIKGDFISTPSVKIKLTGV